MKFLIVGSGFAGSVFARLLSDYSYVSIRLNICHLSARFGKILYGVMIYQHYFPCPSGEGGEDRQSRGEQPRQDDESAVVGNSHDSVGGGKYDSKIPLPVGVVDE